MDKRRETKERFRRPEPEGIEKPCLAARHSVPRDPPCFLRRLAAAVVFQRRNDPGIVHAVRRDVDRGAERCQDSPAGGAPVGTRFGVPADLRAGLALLRAWR